MASEIYHSREFLLLWLSSCISPFASSFFSLSPFFLPPFSSPSPSVLFFLRGGPRNVSSNSYPASICWLSWNKSLLSRLQFLHLEKKGLIFSSLKLLPFREPDMATSFSYPVDSPLKQKHLSLSDLLTEVLSRNWGALVRSHTDGDSLPLIPTGEATSISHSWFSLWWISSAFPLVRRTLPCTLIWDDGPSHFVLCLLCVTWLSLLIRYYWERSFLFPLRDFAGN